MYLNQSVLSTVPPSPGDDQGDRVLSVAAPGSKGDRTQWFSCLALTIHNLHLNAVPQENQLREK